MPKPTKLKNGLAIKRTGPTTHLLYKHDGSEQLGVDFEEGPKVTLSDGEMYDITDMFCSDNGGCDLFRDARGQEISARSALAEAVKIIYFADSNDYVNALWTIVGILGGKAAVALLEGDEWAAYEKYCKEDQDG